MAVSRAGKSASKTSKKKTAGKGGARTKAKARLVRKVIADIEKKIEKNELKPTVGDFIRLVQLEKELQDEEQPQEIKVSWIERDEKEHASEE